MIGSTSTCPLVQQSWQTPRKEGWKAYMYPPVVSYYNLRPCYIQVYHGISSCTIIFRGISVYHTHSYTTKNVGRSMVGAQNTKSQICSGSRCWRRRIATIILGSEAPTMEKRSGRDVRLTKRNESVLLVNSRWLTSIVTLWFQVSTYLSLVSSRLYYTILDLLYIDLCEGTD